ncbi:uncharacterized protein [Drosophila kikkawai]|uniref:Uncharacterized protein n=1 Tax=Drosophila kikkawai TaxID=30033 RepID=A0A6P4IB41_DROKI|nr:uncharacterized protein LOC108076881 [Drosophila kikkawai]
MKRKLCVFLVSVLACQYVFSSTAWWEGLEEPIFKLTQTDKRLEAIVRQIDDLNRLNRSKNRHIAAFAVGSDGFMDYKLSFSSEFDDIYKDIGWIDHLYKYIGEYETARFENHTLIRFAEGTISNERNENTMEKLHASFFGREDFPFGGRNLLKSVAEGYQKYPNRTCRTPQSYQQHLYLLYVDIALTELKSLVMLEWSWLLLGQFGRTEFTVQQEMVREGFKRRMNRTRMLIKDQMSGADQTVWRCNPQRPKAGVTYDEVTRLLQGYIENEVDLSAEETCRHDCAYYQSTRNDKGCHGDEFCSKQPRCRGGLYNCQFVESDLKVCQSAENSHRRYEFIEGGGGRHLGRAKACSRGMDRAKSWVSWFVKCNYCFCLCDEEGPQSDRYFNLRPATADIGRNRVVTGLRFIKHNRIFHLQIQEGELLTHGVINGTTLQWKPLDSYSISDKDVRQDVDYHALSYENRSINLVEVKDDNDFLVTGLRFQVVGGHLNLEAQFTGFDFKSGQLTEQTYWSSANNEKARRKVALENSKVSSETFTSSEPYPSDNDQYVEFTNSGLEEDAAQTTVPLIDIQEVVSEPPFPLSGVGVYYKGSKGHGGYVAPKLITYDFSQKIELPTI